MSKHTPRPPLHSGTSPALLETTPIPDTHIGRTLGGKYHLTARIGAGGMGVVYQAEDLTLHRPVAVKLLPESVAADAEAVRRFLREAQAAARLNHPNVVAVYEADQHDGRCYLVMELVVGGSAADYLKQHGPFPWPAATHLIAEACGGLAAAHAARIIHRDIKPANILLGIAPEQSAIRNPQSAMAKLADFGLAKALDHSAASLTAPGGVMGTPDFMAPEQCRSERVDERSDIYSLGATYFALLTGRGPFVADSPYAVMFAHCSSPVPDPRTLNAAVPEGCAIILQRALAKDPENRYPTVEAMRADLEALLAGTPVAVVAEVPVAVPVPATETQRLDSLDGKTFRLPRRRFLRWLGAGLLGSGVLVGVGHLAGIMRFGHRPAETGPGAPSFRERITEAGLALPLDGTPRAVAISPDGQLLAVALADQAGGVQLWDLTTGNALPRLWAGQPVRSLSFSAAERLLAAAGDCQGSPIQFWHAENRPVPNLGVPTGIGQFVAFSPDGKRCATAVGSPGRFLLTLQVWEMPGQRLLRAIDVPREAILSFTPDGAAVAFSGAPGFVKRYEVDRGAWSPEEFNAGAAVHALTYRPGSRSLVAAADNGLHYWEIGSNKQEPAITWARNQAIACVAFSRDGRLVATGRKSEARATLFNFAAGAANQLHYVPGHEGGLRGAAFAPDGSFVATIGADRMVRLWDIRRWMGR